MKATSNTNRMVQTGIVSVTLALALAIAPVKAASEKSGKASETVANEIQAAVDRLEAQSLDIENAIRFYAPEVSENRDEFLETEAAEIRLGEMAHGFEKAAIYVSPVVDEDFEVSEAMDSLEKMNFQIEQSIRFAAPEISE